MRAAMRAGFEKRLAFKTRYAFIKQAGTIHPREQTMNQIAVELNAIEIETIEQQALSAKQMEEATTELNASQLALIGGGLAIGILI